ncbi:MAG: hypothetical protein D6744_08280 [Planctomycetota bacterium]|nr:MAG: hypothetical protein D6744_08280 [Planctomycetota bacterium]
MRLMRTLAGLAAIGIASSALAGELGDKAAKLQVAKWIKGDPVDVTAADGKTVYVVEFWATWCPPCRASIPHLTELQKKFKDKNVVFIGVSDEDVKTIEPFVKKQGDKMNYTVVADEKRATSKAYMGSFGINGIPHAFVVDQKGRIVWHDHPMSPEFEEVIGKVADGKFDLEAAKKLAAEREAAQKASAERARKLNGLADKYFELVSSKGKEKEAHELGLKLLEAAKEEPRFLNAFSWTVLTGENVVARDVALALKAAEMANKQTKGENPDILDTLALAQFESGQKAKAIETQRLAIKLATEAGASDDAIKEFKERLARYESEQD